MELSTNIEQDFVRRQRKKWFYGRGEYWLAKYMYQTASTPNVISSFGNQIMFFFNNNKYTIFLLGN